MTLVVSASAPFGGSDRTVPEDQTVTAIGPNGHQFFAGLMLRIREGLGGEKVAEQLAAIFGCDVRSAKRYLAGERTPDGNHVALMLEHPVLGPIMAAYAVEWMIANATEADRDRMRMALGMSAARAVLTARQDRIGI